MMRGSESADIGFRWTTLCDGGLSLYRWMSGREIEDQGRTFLVFPTERMVQELKLRIAETGGFTGNIVSMNRLPGQLYDHLGGQTPVIDLSTREMIVRSIMKGMEPGSLSSSREPRPGMVRAVSRAIGELLAQGVSFRHLANSSSTGRSAEFSGIYAEYIKELRRRNLLDRDMLPSAVRDLLGSGERQLSRVGIYLPGELSSSMEGMLSQLISVSAETMIMEHPSRMLPGFLTGIEAGPRPEFDPSIPLPGETALSRLSSERRFPSISGMDRTDTLRRIFREIKRRSLEEGMDPSEFSVVLPIRQDHDDIVRELSGEYGVPVDQGEDLRLERVPLVSAILGLIESFLNGLRRPEVVASLSSPFFRLRNDEGRTISGQDLESVTRAAMMGPERRDPFKGWKNVLEDLSSSEGVDAHTVDLASRIAGPLSRFLKNGENMAGSRKAVGEHTSGVLDLLKDLDVHERLVHIIEEGERLEGSLPGEGPFQLNVSGIHGFYSAIRAVERRARILVEGKITFREFVTLLRLEISKISVRSSPRVPGVRIMGLTESVGLPHGTVFFAGLSEGEMPPHEGGFRLLSEKERDVLKLPHERGRRQFLEQLAIAVGSSGDPVLCYHRSSSDRPLSVSSFIEDIQLVPVEERGDMRSPVDVQRRIGELSDPSYMSYRDRGNDEKLEIFSVPDLLRLTGDAGERIGRCILSMRDRRSRESDGAFGRITEEDMISCLADRYGQEHIWSVTQFETYRKCPYSFFVRYVLGIRELEDLEPGIPPEKKGLIFHSVADRFYREFPPVGGPRVDRSNLEAARGIIKDITGEILARYPNSGPYWDALLDQFVGGPEEKGLLDSFLEVEANYPGHFVVDRTELRFGMGEGSYPPVSVSLPGDEGGPDRFQLGGSIDRLDILRTPRGDLTFIWDYKTGSRVDEESVQVPLYLSAVRGLFPGIYPGGGGYYYVRKRGAVERDPTLGASVWSGMTSGEEELQSVIKELDGRVHDTVQLCLEMVDKMRSGEFGADVKCRDKWCPFSNVCRRGDAR